MMISSIEEIRLARLAQADIKEKLFAKELELSEVKAEVYLNAVDNKQAHFVAINTTTQDATVKKLKRAVAALEVEHYRAWIKTSDLVMRNAADNRRDASEGEPIFNKEWIC